VKVNFDASDDACDYVGANDAINYVDTNDDASNR
jgi:hypothetical protein